MQWKELIKKLKDTSIPFDAIKNYWFSWDYYNKLQFYIKDNHHIEEERIGWAKKDLDAGIKEARSSLEKLNSFSRIKKNVESWLSFLQEERARLEIPEITCSKAKEPWFFLTFNGAFLPPLRFEDQMLSFFIPQKIEWQRSSAFYETKPIKAHLFRFSIFYDEEYLHLILKMEQREGNLSIFFDPSYSRKNYYQYNVDLEKNIRKENCVELVYNRGLKYKNWESDVRIEENKGEELTFHFLFPFENLKSSPQKDSKWGFNICYTHDDGSFAFSPMLGSTGAPARFGRLIFSK
ncbi:MAG: hypothetical protein KAX20_06620 [Candidatus Omnitrophica bacterium]|nr:hypothetical protein [Candidatus Omnitrophota bacterium]